MVEVESQLESEQLFRELAMQPSSIHKDPTNHYQHFVNAYVLTNQMMKQVDAVKCAEVEWKERVAESEDQYVAVPAEHLKFNRPRMKRIDSFLGTINFINCRLCIWHIAKQLWLY